MSWAPPAQEVRAIGRATADDAFALQPVFSGWRKIANVAGILFWFAAMLYFWVWWFEPEHIYTPGRYALVTFVLLWCTLVPAYFIFLFNGARIPARPPPPAPPRRAAMVVTKAPSEPFAIVKKTLEAALAQKGPDHDTWLADEDPDAETLAWCRANGVEVSSRKGIAEYHARDWPRRTRCKEGNLAYFYDRYGYERYDFVSQFDADHVPSPDYLKHALQPFADPAVGYVSAPSICDSNADESWSARGRLYLEASMHGALQCGYNGGWAPLCIGSHYTVRTAALRAIGGLGPELAEDHSTTLMMNANGWKGVHAVDAIAHGEGPWTFADLITQEFQWSRSLVTILLCYTPKYVSGLTPRLRFQFLFSELWYPSFSSMMALMYAMPIAALLTGSLFVRVSYVAYFLHILPLSLVLMGLAWWWRSTGLFRPQHASILSWEGMAFLFLRWPWSLFGTLMALWDRVAGSEIDFRITPKGGRRADALPYRVIAPYVALALAAAGTAWLVKDPGSAAGFYIFALLGAVTYGLLVALILVRHARENRCPVFRPSLNGAASAASLLAIVALISLATYENGAQGTAAMNAGINVFTLTETLYTPSGAGQARRKIVRFHPRWHGFGGEENPQVPKKSGAQVSP